MRRFLRFLFFLAVVVALLFYLGGGWYFSEELIADGFTVTHSEDELNSLVVEIDQDVSLTIEPGDGEDSEADRPGVFGLDWGSGYGRVGDVTETIGDSVTREILDTFDGFERPPEVGVPVDVDPYAYPDRLPNGWETTAVETPVGPMEAWFAPGSDDTWVIHIHGKGADRSEALRAAIPLAAAGYPQLVISYRNDEGAAADPSGYYQYGVSEWRDLEAALASAAESGAGDVVLYGYSTGAAVAMAYMERVPNSAVIGAVFDSPNIDFATTVDYNAAARDLPLVGLPVPGSLAWAARTITAIRIDIDWDAIDYIDRVDRLAVPVLVFHGTDDSSVPIETSRRLAEASNLVELVEVEGAEHVQSWNAGPEDYQRRVLEGIATMEATAGS